MTSHFTYGASHFTYGAMTLWLWLVTSIVDLWRRYFGVCTTSTTGDVEMEKNGSCDPTTSTEGDVGIEKTFGERNVDKTGDDETCTVGTTSSLILTTFI